MSKWYKFRRSNVSEMRDYVEGEDLDRVSISDADKDAGSPKAGDMIARNPKNHDDKWLAAADYVAENFERIESSQETCNDCNHFKANGLEVENEY